MAEEYFEIEIQGSKFTACLMAPGDAINQAEWMIYTLQKLLDATG